MNLSMTTNKIIIILKIIKKIMIIYIEYGFNIFGITKNKTIINKKVIGNYDHKVIS